MTTLFEENRKYKPKDPEILELLGNPEKQKQMRHYKRSPSYYRLGRSIVYLGKDLNEWANAQRVECNQT